MSHLDKDLALNLSVQEIVREYRSSRLQVRTAHETLEQQEKRLTALLSDKYLHVLDDLTQIDKIKDEILSGLDKKFWEFLVKKIKIRKVLSQKRRDELDDQIESGDFPEITVENVHGTVESLLKQAKKFAQESIVEVYDYLRPRDSYKNNSLWEVGGRVIIENVIIAWGNGVKVDTWAAENILAIDRVFHFLDGEPFLKEEGYYMSPLTTAISESAEGETEYFKYKCHGNGNLHLWFPRDDLVQEFNRVAGGGMLRERS